MIRKMDHFDHSKCNLFSSFQAYNPNTKQGFLLGHFSIQTEQKHRPLGGWIITCSCTDKRANTKCLYSSECFRSNEVSLKQLLSSLLSAFSLKAVSPSFLGHSYICLAHVTQASTNNGKKISLVVWYLFPERCHAIIIRPQLLAQVYSKQMKLSVVVCYIG